MATQQPAFQDGKVPFKIPSRNDPCETYYKIYGDLRTSSSPPLVILHGGPGSGHEYIEPYSKIWSNYGIPVVFYDQIGCGQSTHLPETIGDKSFWQPSLFVSELENLLDHLHLGRADGPGFHILGHSWGGTLAVALAARQPPGLRRLILANANSDSQLLKKNIWDLRLQLSPEHQRAIDEALEKDDFTLPAYLEAMKTFSQTYLCRVRPFPSPELAKNFQHQAADPTVRRSMQGRSPFLYDGSLEHYSNIPLLPKINVPTLVFNGEFDTAHDSSVVKFFEHIPKVRWVTLVGASHMPHLDSEELLEKCLRLVGSFLRPEGDSST